VPTRAVPVPTMTSVFTFSKQQPVAKGQVAVHSDDDERARKEFAAKEHEQVGLLSALLLGFAGGGFFAGAEMEPGVATTTCVVSLCFAVQCFIGSSVMAGVYLITILRSKLPLHCIERRLGIAVHVPKIYFVAGAISSTVGIVSFLVYVLGDQQTFFCIATCFPVVVIPTLFPLYAVFKMSYLSSEDASHEEMM